MPIDSWDVEAGVDHSQRLKEPLGHDVGERLAGCAREQDAEHVVGGVVGPPIPGLVHQRDPGEPAHPLVGRWHLTYLHRALVQLLHEQRHDLRLRGREAVACGVGEQVAGRDRPLARHRVIELARRSAQHERVGQLGKKVVDWAVEVEAPVLDQHHRQRRDQRLGERGRPDDRLTTHGSPARALGAQHRHFHTELSGDERHEPGNVSGVDVGS